MTNKFINLSNHPNCKWGEEQLAEAHRFGVIIDIPFPSVPEHYSHAEILEMAETYFSNILRCTDRIPCTVHIMGEMTFTYAMVNLLKAAGYTCVASTSKRIVEELPDGSKNVKFEFCQFREY